MSEEALKVQAKAAFWGLVALIGSAQAAAFMRKLIAEASTPDDDWSGPGSR